MFLLHRLLRALLSPFVALAVAAPTPGCADGRAAMDAAPPADATARDACCAGDARTGGDTDASGPRDGGGLPLYARCTANADCASMLCHLYPGRGASFCSQPCKVDADCPAPSPGCNMMGICRIP